MSWKPHDLGQLCISFCPVGTLPQAAPVSAPLCTTN